MQLATTNTNISACHRHLIVMLPVALPERRKLVHDDCLLSTVVLQTTARGPRLSPCHNRRTRPLDQRVPAPTRETARMRAGGQSARWHFTRTSRFCEPSLDDACVRLLVRAETAVTHGCTSLISRYPRSIACFSSSLSASFKDLPDWWHKS